MENNSIMCREFQVENEELKRNLALSLNKPLIKKLNEALNRINSGEYVSVKRFL